MRLIGSGFSFAAACGATRLILEKASELDPKIVFVGFRISTYHRQNVGWVECNETQQNLELALPNLQDAKRPRIESTYFFEASYELTHKRILDTVH